jgi:pyruvate dehydrogenase E2 component (dihydrolipoamide acetyltransferase)
MPTERDFLLPDLGEGLEEAEVVRWQVAEGEAVELNQPLVEVDTAKALVEIPSPFAGVVVRLHAAEGDVVRVGRPLVTIALEEGEEEGAGAEAPALVDEAQAVRPKRRPVLVGYGVEEEEAPAPAAEAGAERARRDGPARATPPVRRRARELGVDLAAVAGTGSGGRITREDVEKAAGSTAVGPAAEVAERVPVRGVRRRSAEHMARSVREIPHVTTFLTIDATNLEAFRADIKAATGERVSPLPIVVRALAEVCRDHPKLNASFDSGRSEIVLFKACNVGIATETERGLLVPVVRDAGSMGILELSREIVRLVEAARAATIRPEDMAGGTITVTNVGTFGAEYGTPIINHPEGAILALGVIEPRALVVDGAVEARLAATLSLSFDHRLLDGAEAGRALRALGDLLESPFRLGALPR